MFQKRVNLEACIGYFGIRDIGLFFFKGYWDICVFYFGIFRNFGIWDIGIYFGIRVKLISEYGIFWTVYFVTLTIYINFLSKHQFKAEDQ